MSPATESPRVSVVVPAYYSHATIGACLEALERQELRDFEVIVVNSSPETETEHVVRGGFPWVIFEESPTRLLPHAARNRGVELAHGELLVFTDPDCVADRGWLSMLVAACSAQHPVTCGAMALLDSGRFALAVHLSKFAAWLPGLAAGSRAIAPTANACYSRAIWDQIGPFPAELFSGDTLQSWKATAAGAKPWFEPRAIVSHRHPGTARSFLGERLQRGREFGGMRAEAEGWSRARAATYVAATPLLPAVQVARQARYAARAGWTRELVRAFPLLVAGAVAWSIGEVRAYASRVA